MYVRRGWRTQVGSGLDQQRTRSRFHSNDFRLIDLRRLDYVGNAHLPMYLALSYEPAREQEQPKPEEDPDDREQADEMVERT